MARKMAVEIINRRALLRLGFLALVIVILFLICWPLMIGMPEESWSGPLPPLTEGEAELAEELRAAVERLAVVIGERNITHRMEALQRAADFIEESLVGFGCSVERQSFQAMGRSCDNLAVEIPGSSKKEEIVVVGAHYDTVPGSPGANDNGSGVAAALALARIFSGKKPDRTIRFVFFTNEEPPFFQTKEMGSLVYARRCEERGEDVAAMLALETMGCFLDGDDSQKYPPPLGFFYPSQGNFIAFVGNTGSRRLVRDVVASFRRRTSFPSEGAALPGILPGIAWSDHWSFWKAGYQAVMVTDTAPFRYPHYHLASDTPDKIDFEKLARVVAGLELVLDELVGATPP